MNRMTNKYKGFIFDLNGTLIDDMAYHTDAWYEVLVKELGANISYENVKAEMYGKNEEVLARIFGKNHFGKEELNRHSINKEAKYQELYKPSMQLLPGLENFLENAASSGIAMAIGSAAIMHNIDFIVDGMAIRQYFQALISADEVDLSKPEPETFLKAADALNLKPQECLVFEDAPKGVEAAQNAGMDALVITTMHDKNEFRRYPNIIGFIEDYHDDRLKGLLTA